MTLYELAQCIHPGTPVELTLYNDMGKGELLFQGYANDLPMRLAELNILTINVKDDRLVMGVSV